MDMNNAITFENSTRACFPVYVWFLIVESNIIKQEESREVVREVIVKEG